MTNPVRRLPSRSRTPLHDHVVMDPAGAWTAPATDLKDGLSLQALLAFLRRRKLLVLLPALGVSLAVLATVALLPSRYRAEAIVAAEPETVLGQPTATGPEIDAERQAASLTAILHRPTLLSRVLRDIAAVPAGAAVGEREIRSARRRVTVRTAGDRVFALGFEDTDPLRAAAGASRLALLLSATARTERQQKSAVLAEFLEAQLPDVAARLAEQQKALELYQEKNLGEVPDQVPASTKLLESALARLQAATARITLDEARRAELEGERRSLEAQGVTTRRPASRDERRLAQLEVTRDALRKRYGDQHPGVLDAEAEIEQIEATSNLGGTPEYTPTQQRYFQLGPEIDALASRLSQSQAEAQAIQKEVAALRERIEVAPRHQMAIATMTRALEATRAQYQALLDRASEARLAERFGHTAQGDAFRVVEPPRVPTAPVGPKRLRLALMGILGGVGLGLAAALGREQMDRSFTGVDDVRSTTRLQVLASIPHIPRSRRNGHGLRPSVPVLDDPEGHAAEQYRILAARLALPAGPRRPLRVVITSPLAGDGKTTTAVNLALALAQIVPEDVLLVDADIGRSTVHKHLGLERSDGLGRLLRDPSGNPVDYVRRRHGICLLEAGPFSSETRAALASPAAARVFYEIRKRFAYVIVDAPPVLAVAETILLERMVDATVLVVRAHRTPRDLVRRTLESLDPSRLCGVLLNEVQDEPLAYAYPYAKLHLPDAAAATAGAASR